MNRWVTLIISLFLFCPTTSFGVITFTDGSWSTTFNCADWNQGDTLTCDGLRKGLDETCNGTKDEITINANNSLSIGKGFRHYKGDGINVEGGGVNIDFPSAQTEFWLRWYMRYQSGFQWLSLNYDKHMYIITDAPSTAVIAEFWYDRYVAIAQNTPNYYQVQTAEGDGWTGVMGGATGDGLFHSYEVYLKMDTDSTNGVGRIWIDGVLVAENTGVDFSGGNATARLGWTAIGMGSNQREPNNGGCYYADFDDVAIYTTMPPNVDSSANPMIGQIDTTAPVLSALTPSGAQSCLSDPRNVIESLTTDEAATCRAHDTESTWATMTEMSTTGGTNHSRTVSRACGTSWTPYYMCQDAALNESAASQGSYSVSAAVAAAIGGAGLNATQGPIGGAGLSGTPTGGMGR